MAEKPPACPQIIVNRPVSHLPLEARNLPFQCCLSTQAALSTGVKPPLSLTLHGLAGAESADCHSARLKYPRCLKRRGTQPLWFLKPDIMGTSLRPTGSLLRGSCVLPMGTGASLCLSHLPNHSDAAASLYLVVSLSCRSSMAPWVTDSGGVAT